MNKLLIGTGLVVLTVTALATVLWFDKQSTAVSNDQTPNKIVSVRLVEDGATALSAGGQIAYLDPVTGQLTSKPADSLTKGSALQAQVNLPPIKITTYADGTVQADLNGRFRTPLMATIGCDGKLTTEHSDKLEPKVEECGANQ
jgi:hypothetical protein